MMEEIVVTFLEAAAHEILSRPTWSLRADTPRQHAAAAGYLAFVKARRERSRMFGVVVGGLMVSASTLFFYRKAVA